MKKSAILIDSFLEILRRKKHKRFALIAEKISDFAVLYDKYYCNERLLFFLIKKVISEVYSDKKIVSIDMEKQLIYELKNEKITLIKVKNSHQKEIKKRLIELLERRRDQIFLKGNSAKIKEFYRDFLGEINRFFITRIEDNNVFLELKNVEKKIPERLFFMINIDDFLDQDRIAREYHFLFFIKNIEIKDERILVKMTRKKSKIIEKEIENVFDFIEKKYGKSIDYKVNFVDFTTKKVVMSITDNAVESILKSVKKIIKSRLGFEIFWKKRGKRDEKTKKN